MGCSDCEKKATAMHLAEAQSRMAQLACWELAEEGRILRCFVKTRDFVESLELANQLGDLAETEGHHPDLLVAWGKLRIDLSTHSAGGITEADFSLARKIDDLLTLHSTRVLK